MITVDNQTDTSIETGLLKPIADALSSREIELILCDDATIRTLNREHRNLDKATDVLSFPLEGELPGQPLGALVISLDHVHARAEELGHSPEEELALLFIHGLLHLLGYDHETDRGEMRAEEARLIREFGLPESLIVRTEGAR
jgi:probable rRNA maturation factor